MTRKRVEQVRQAGLLAWRFGGFAGVEQRHRDRGRGGGDPRGRQVQHRAGGAVLRQLLEDGPGVVGAGRGAHVDGDAQPGGIELEAAFAHRHLDGRVRGSTGVAGVGELDTGRVEAVVVRALHDAQRQGRRSGMESECRCSEARERPSILQGGRAFPPSGRDGVNHRRPPCAAPARRRSS